MRTLLTSVIVIAMTVLLLGQQTPDPRKTTKVNRPDISTKVPRFQLTPEPTVFLRGKPVTITASFTSPGPCGPREDGIVLRLYNIDETSGEPTFQTKYLQGVGAQDLPSAKGQEQQTKFDSILIPETANEKIYFAVFNVCRSPGPHHPQIGNRIGGARFRFACSTASVCGYKAD